jgi:DNA-binding CsgD family transcriptional regulator
MQQQSSDRIANLRKLSGRQRQLLTLQCEKLSDQQIAERMTIAIGTVGSTRHAAYVTLDLQGQTPGQIAAEMQEYCKLLVADGAPPPVPAETQEGLFQRWRRELQARVQSVSPILRGVVIGSVGTVVVLTVLFLSLVPALQSAPMAAPQSSAAPPSNAVPNASLPTIDLTRETRAGTAIALQATAQAAPASVSTSAPAVAAAPLPTTGPTASPTQAPPTPIQTPSPTATSVPPSPTPFPPGSTIYQTSDFAGWGVGNSGWKLSDNTLVADNSLDQYHPIFAPATLTTVNYKISATIEVPDVQQAFPAFGFVARTNYSLGVSGLPGAGSNLVILRCCTPNGNADLLGLQEIARQPFTPARRTRIDYTAELKGTSLSLSASGTVLDAADTTYLTPGKVGLLAIRTSIIVYNFKVIAL